MSCKYLTKKFLASNFSNQLSTMITKFNICLSLFQIFGLYPVKVYENSKFYFIYGVVAVNVVINCGVIIFMIIAEDYMFFRNSIIGKIADILVYASLAFAHFSIIFESFYKRKYFTQFWNFFNKINNQTRESRFIDNFLLKLVIYLTFTFIIECAVLCNIYGVDEQWTYFWEANIFSLMATRMKNIQHTFFIDIIYFYVRDLNLNLRNLKNSSSTEDIKIKIVKIKSDFKILIKMLMIVNKIFAWSQAMNIGQQFIEIVSEFYWIYAYARSDYFVLGV